MVHMCVRGLRGIFLCLYSCPLAMRLVTAERIEKARQRLQNVKFRLKEMYQKFCVL